MSDTTKLAYEIRVMTMEDYDQVYDLWMSIHGFGIRSIDDSKEGIERFLRRNPSTSMVAVVDGKVVGSILCGHDGRRACFYHVCVAESYRKQGIGKRMAGFAEEALKKDRERPIWTKSMIKQRLCPNGKWLGSKYRRG